MANANNLTIIWIVADGIHVFPCLSNNFQNIFLIICINQLRLAQIPAVFISLNVRNADMSMLERPKLFAALLEAETQPY
jgi:hypothetical protein